MTLMVAMAGLVLGFALGFAVVYLYMAWMIKGFFAGYIDYLEDEDGFYPIIKSNLDPSEISEQKYVIFKSSRFTQGL